MTAYDSYFALDEQTAVQYVLDHPELSGRFKPNDQLVAHEVGDGNLNVVFKIYAEADRARTLVLKQALPYVRIVGDSWPLPLDRARIEAQALSEEFRLCPEHTPEVYCFDPVMYLIAMRNLDDHIILRKGLMAGIVYPHLAGHLGTFLARTLSNTSDLVLDYKTKKEKVAQFINPELCKITEDLVFTEPYRKTERNGFHAELAPQVEALQANDALRAEVAIMKEKFMTHAQALIHGDLHTGSIMVNQQETYVIDPEFAFYGPMGFDIGAVIGNLFLSYASHEVRSKDPAKRKQYRAYLISVVVDLWHVFEREFQQVWDRLDQINMPIRYQQDYMRRLLHDSVGFAACKMLRRIIGFAGVADIRGIEDVQERTIAASLGLNIGRALLMQRETLDSIEEIVDAATACTFIYP